MLRTRLSKFTLSILAGALLLAPSAAQAQVFGFPVFGGFGRFGGFGGFGFGGFGGNMNMWGLYRPFYSYPFAGMGYAPYGGYPGMYGGYGNNRFMFNAGFDRTIILPGFPASGDAPRMRSSLYPALAVAPRDTIRPAAYETSTRARIEITVPTADTEVSLQGVPMKQSGTVRSYVSPPLDSNSKYSYDVRVRWRDQNGEQSRTRQVSVRAGSSLVLDFTKKQ